MSGAQIADIAAALSRQPKSRVCTTYSITTDARRPGEYVLRFGSAPSLIVEVYRDLAAALIRADDLRRGIESAQWIVADRVVPAIGSTR